MQILLSSNPNNLRRALEGRMSATVEAEYGDEVVEGSLVTLAHHGPRSGNLCPCLEENYDDIINPIIEVIGISHVDLDTLGGVAALWGRKPEDDSFWKLAAFVDENGMHKIHEADASEKDVQKLWAYKALASSDPIFPPKDGSVADVTLLVRESISALACICEEGDIRHKIFLNAGKEYRIDDEGKIERSFVSMTGGVIVRVAPYFTSAYYETSEGRGDAIVSYNTRYGSITVSFYGKELGQNARDIVQALFGPEAGGHDLIAGSPRGKRMTFQDLHQTAELVYNRLSNRLTYT
jgi:hypothetical protein